MKLFFQKDYFEEDENSGKHKEGKPERNWCDRNFVIKEPGQSRLYFIWQLIFMSAFLIEIVLVPYTSCRQMEGEEHIINIDSILQDYTKELEIAIDAIWIINITLSFLTPFELVNVTGYNDNFIMIAKNYLFGTFIIDTLSTLYIFVDYSNEYRWMYYLKFLRFVYFFKATAILHAAIDPIVSGCKVSKQAKANISDLTLYVIGMSTIMHIIACGWIYVGEEPEWGTWIKAFVPDRQHDATTVYIHSLYWVVTTLTTVGYGDIFGTTEAEFIFTMVVEFIGILVFSIIMSTVNGFL